MNAIQPLTIRHDGQPSASGLPVGDLRGFGRIRGDAALMCLALDRQAGYVRAPTAEAPLLAITTEGNVRWTQAYVPGTNVLETTGRLAESELCVVDFMALAEGRPGQGEAVTAGRFVRLITCTEGEVSFRLVCTLSTDATNDAEGVSAATAKGWHVASSRPFRQEAGHLVADIHLAPGESAAFVIADRPLSGGAGLIANTLHGLGDSIHFWTWWSDRCRYRGDDFADRLRKALTLKLACAPGGGLLREDASAEGFAPAPLGDCSRAAASFLELGYRQECVDLLGYVQANRGPVDAGPWHADEHFMPALATFADRYGVSGLPTSLRDVLPGMEQERRAS